MPLVERLAVVREGAPAHLGAAAEADLEEPVRVGQRLARGGDDVGLAAAEDPLGLLEGVDPARDDHGDGESRVPHGAPHRGGEGDVPAEGAALIGVDRRHALEPALAGVGIGRLSQGGLLRVLELPALAHREDVGAPAGELRPEPRGLLGTEAALDDLVPEVADPDAVPRSHPRPHRRQDLPREPHAVLPRSPVAVGPEVERGEERGHRVGVGVVQLDAVEPRLAGAGRRVGEEPGERLRKIPHVGDVHVPHALPMAEVEGLPLPRRQHPVEEGPRRRQQVLAHLGIRGREPSGLPGGLRESPAQVVRHGEVAPEIVLRGRPPADGEEVDDLDEEAGVPSALAAHRLHEVAQAREEPVVPDAQERPARDVADPGSFHDQCTGPALGEAAVPVHDLAGDDAVLRGAPGDHGGHPGPLLGRQGPADPDRGEPERRGRLLLGRPAGGGDRMADALQGHGRDRV